MKQCKKCGDPFEPKRIAGDHFTSWCNHCITGGLAQLVAEENQQLEPESDRDEFEKDQCHGEE